MYVFLPCTATVQPVIGPSATSAVALSTMTVAMVAVSAVISRFLLLFDALSVPTDRRITSPILKPSVRYEPAPRVTVQVGPVPAIVMPTALADAPAVDRKSTRLNS